MIELTLEEVMARTKISRRNIKYWTALYDLEVRRQGRRNFYPERTVRILDAVGRLAEFGYFSTEYIRVLIDLALSREIKDRKTYERYRSARPAMLSALDLPQPAAPPEPPTADSRPVRGADTASQRDFIERAVEGRGAARETPRSVPAVPPLATRRTQSGLRPIRRRRDDESLL